MARLKAVETLDRPAVLRALPRNGRPCPLPSRRLAPLGAREHRSGSVACRSRDRVNQAGPPPGAVDGQRMEEPVRALRRRLEESSGARLDFTTDFGA